MIIYWDIVFILNIFMNFMILWLTAIISKRKIHLLRICLGAAIGSIFLIALFYPTLHFFFTFTMKLLLSLFIVIITFYPSNLKDLINLILSFYAVSFVLGGVAFGIFYFTGFSTTIYNGVLIFENKIIPWWILLISLFIVAILIKFSLSYIQQRFFREKMLAHVTIFLHDDFSEVKALVDTGNSLYDPFTNAPVIVVEYKTLKNLLSEELQTIFENEQDGDLDLLTERLTNSQMSTRFRVIPFSSIGRPNGILVGFKPDKVLVKTDEEELEVTESVVGIYNNIISAEGRYKALLNPDILKC
ncbi:MAG TPA: sigma-E processing peptidase SpoIIGA [Thermoanaerobacterales bacterium]|nr:sigma-E processing peptidase SpoIIGA [Thermoanaerobacterales bacterium]